MKKILTQYVVCALAVALMVPLAPAQSQPAGLQAAFAKDAGTLSDKFAGLARIMPAIDKCDESLGIGLAATNYNQITFRTERL